MRTLAALVLALELACGPSSPAVLVAPPEIPPPLPVVAATAADYAACAHLGILGCPETWPREGLTCIETFVQARTYHVAIPTCFTTAVDVAAVRACGGPDTLTFECRP